MLAKVGPAALRPRGGATDNTEGQARGRPITLEHSGFNGDHKNVLASTQKETILHRTAEHLGTTALSLWCSKLRYYRSLCKVTKTQETVECEEVVVGAGAGAASGCSTHVAP